MFSELKCIAFFPPLECTYEHMYIGTFVHSALCASTAPFFFIYFVSYLLSDGFLIKFSPVLMKNVLHIR